MQYRPYQQHALSRGVALLTRGTRYVLIAVATGGGKTLIGLTLAAQYTHTDGIVYWLAYQRELLERTERELEALVRAGLIERRVQFRFASVQSAMRNRIPRNTALIVVDEAHHMHGDNQSWRWLRSLRKPVIGLTGTPRSTATEEGWEIACQFSAADLTPEYLAAPRGSAVRTSLTPRHVATRRRFYGSEFDEETYRALDTPARNRFVADTLWARRHALHKTLVFVHHVEHIHSLMKELGRRGFMAGCVHGELSAGERAHAFRSFADGPLQVLVNAQLAGEGIDIPAIRTVVMAVPTLSDIRFAQMIGRGARKVPGKHEFGVIDFHDNLGRFEHVVTSRTLFAGSTGRPSAEYVAAPREPVPYEPQPWIAELTKMLAARLFTTGYLSVEHVEQAILTFATDAGITLSVDGMRPYEVQLVRHVHPVIAERMPKATVRVEVPCVSGRADLVVDEPRLLSIYEFSVERVTARKAEQLLRYVRDLRGEARGRPITPHLIAMSYEGDSASRTIHVDGVAILFTNWHDFLCHWTGRGRAH
ncbi:MAG: helicase-related protein [Polyangiales bacterium]